MGMNFGAACVARRCVLLAACCDRNQHQAPRPEHPPATSMQAAADGEAPLPPAGVFYELIRVAASTPMADGGDALGALGFPELTEVRHARCWGGGSAEPTCWPTHLQRWAGLTLLSLHVEPHWHCAFNAAGCAATATSLPRLHPTPTHLPSLCRRLPSTTILGIASTCRMTSSRGARMSRSRSSGAAARERRPWPTSCLQACSV